jgi:hypothetical protein
MLKLTVEHMGLHNLVTNLEGRITKLPMLTLYSFQDIITNVHEQHHDLEGSYATCYPVKVSSDRDCEVIDMETVLFWLFSL